MTKIAHLSISKHARKYNETLRKKLAAANIKVTEQSTKYGHSLYVADADFLSASKIILTVPFK
jgi:hypothetical protein